MKRIFLSLLFCAIASSSLFAAETVTAEESKKIIDGIYNKMEPAFRKYSGFFGLRTTKFKMTDSKTGAHIESTESLVKIKNDFNDAPEPVQVIKFIKNGQEQPVSKFTERKQLQFYPVFDDKGRERYSIEITGTKKINDIDCYVLNIIPKQKTTRHYSGNMFISKKELNLVAFEGAPAALEKGVQAFSINTIYKTMENLPIVIKSQIEIFIHVPVFFPNKKMTIDVEIKDHELILK